MTEANNFTGEYSNLNTTGKFRYAVLPTHQKINQNSVQITTETVRRRNFSHQRRLRFMTEHWHAKLHTTFYYVPKYRSFRGCGTVKLSSWRLGASHFYSARDCNMTDEQKKYFVCPCHITYTDYVRPPAPLHQSETNKWLINPSKVIRYSVNIFTDFKEHSSIAAMIKARHLPSYKAA